MKNSSLHSRIGSRGDGAGIYRLALAVALLLCLWSTHCSAQPVRFTHDLRFDNFNSQSGFVTNRMLRVLRSKRGYLWVAGNGLYRFDGRQFVHFSKLDDRPGNIRDNQTPWLWEDEYERIWIAGNGGICYYDEYSDRFNYQDIDTGRRITSSAALCHLGPDLWFMCNYGLCRINTNTLKIDTTAINAPFNCLAIHPISKDKLLLSRRNGSYYVYDIRENTYKVNALRQDIWVGLWDIAEYKDRLWFATSDGIWWMRGDTAGHVPGTRGVLGSSLCFAPGLTGDSIILIGSEGRGLQIFDLRSGKVENTYMPDANNPYSILGVSISAVYVDPQNIAWVCTENGLSAVNYRNQYFKAHLLPENMLLRIAQDSSDRNIVWMSGYQHGLSKINWETKAVVRNYHKFKNTLGFSYEGSSILNMYQVNKETWLLSSYASVFTWNSRTGEERRISDIPARYFVNYMRDSFFIVTSDSIYLCRLPSCRIDPLCAAGGLNDGQFDGRRYLWLATENGLLRYDPAGRSKKVFRTDASIDHGRASIMRKVVVDRKGRIVCGTVSGVVVFDTASRRFSYYESLGGNVHPDCYDIRLSDSLAIVETNGGLVTLNLNTGQSFITNLRDKNTYSDRPIGMVNDEFVLSMKYEYAYFDPRGLSDQQQPSVPLVERIKVNNRVIRLPTDTSMQALQHDENEITFYFTAFEFMDPGHIMFRYKVEGLDTAWNYASTHREAHYMRIPPGRYSFLLQAGNVNGTWNPVQAKLKFTIVPAYWQTWWFKIVVALGFIGLVTGIAALRIRSIKKRELEITRVNREKAEMELKALRSQMNPHFIFNSLNSIQKFIWENKQEDASEYLTKFARLMRQILDSSMKKLITLEQELGTLALYIELEHRRSNNKFDYRINVDDNIDTAHILVPSLILQPYIENAIWHGLLHKDDRGELNVSILYNEQVGEICYVIDDNGIGRERSRQINIRKSASYGMQITEQRLAMSGHGGRQAKVLVEDKYDGQGKAIGTRIEITIPITDFVKV